MTNITLDKIPYVDGNPEDSHQSSITWINDGELLEGATPKSKNDGNLNKAGVQLQENIVTLDNNSQILLNEILNIKSILDSGCGESLVDKVNSNSSEIVNLLKYFDILSSTYNYNKIINIISDGSINSASNINSEISLKLMAIDGSKSLFSSTLEEINLNNLNDIIKCDTILINASTYDYLNGTELGSISDAIDDYSGPSTFYSELYKLLNTIISSDVNPRAFITNGIKLPTMAGYNTSYPNPNNKGYKLEDYSNAVTEVSKIFSIPIIDTLHEIGISSKNSDIFTDENGLSTLGINRFVNLVSGYINSK